MGKKNEEESGKDYRHDDLPKAKNWIVYHYRCLLKIVHLIMFGLGALLLSCIVFPLLRIFYPKKEKFQPIAREVVSAIFRQFLYSTRNWGLTRFEKFDMNKFKDLHSRIIVANHPSLLDFVFIMGMVPNANCIVRGGLLKTPVGGVIKNAYIANSLDFDELCSLCKQTLDRGDNVIIFQEGTRTPRHGRNQYKKGAARIAYYAKCNLLPIFIGGSDKYGLGKNDPLWSFNKIERMLYDFTVLPEVKYEDFKDLSETIAAKRMTEKCEEEIVGCGEEYNKNHPNCETVNNI